MLSAFRPTSRLRALLLTGLVSVAACLAPTLPVPPPSQPEVSSPDASGMVTVKGGPGSATAGATITVWNVTYEHSAECAADPNCEPGRDRIVLGDGSYSMLIPAKSHDTLDVWQTVGTNQSAPTETRVP